MQAFSNTSISSLNKTNLKGLFQVRCEILDYCKSEEEASLITGHLHKKVTELEKLKPEIGIITKFSLKYSISENNDAEFIDVQFICNKDYSVGECRLHYRNGSLTPFTEEETLSKEMIPFSMHGAVIDNVCSQRMKQMLINSKDIIRKEVKDIATSVIDCLCEHVKEEKNKFTLFIYKKKIKISCEISQGETFSMSLPVSWFVISKSIYNTKDVALSDND